MSSSEGESRAVPGRQSSVKMALLLVLVLAASVFGAAVYGYAMHYSGQAAMPQKSAATDPAASADFWQSFEAYSSVMSYSTAVSLMHSPPANATVYTGNNTIVFHARANTVYVFAMGEVFVIDGLVNPVLVVPSGASLEVVFVNLDSTESHDFAVTSLAPPYSGNPLNDVFAKESILQAMPFVPPVNGFSAHTFSKVFSFGEGGVFWYVCLYPGCAALGMYGEIIVR